MDFWTKIKTISRGFSALRDRDGFFWFALIFLDLLLMAPAILLNPGQFQIIPLPPLHAPRGWYDTVLFFFRRENQDMFRIAADYLILLTLLLATARLRWHRLIRGILVAVYFFLFIYHFYDAAIFRVFDQPPLFYNDFQLLLGGLYLVADISASHLLVKILLLFTGLAALFLLIPFLFAAVDAGLTKRRHHKRFLRAGALLWVFVLAMTFWFGFTDYRSSVRWIAPRVAVNIRESVKLRRTLQAARAQPPDSSYYRYSKIRLRHPPVLYLFMIESYGKILLDDPATAGPYREFMRRVADTLGSAGWKMVSNFSEAPVSGGKSWLSVGSVLTGLRIRDQAVYTYLINRMRNYPHLVHFLNGNHYRTFTLQPLNRQRPGFSMANYERFFEFKRYINFEDLQFDGPKFGFRSIPDQYSLNFAHREFLAAAPRPYFLMFMTVSSHSPWTELPVYVADWRRMLEMKPEDIRHRKIAGNMRGTLNTRFLAGLTSRDYMKHIFYEWKMLQDYLLDAAPDSSLILILGDHQPPLITPPGSDFLTPIHAISKNQSLLNDFLSYGFVRGPLKGSEGGGAIHHEGLYSLLVRILAKNYGDGNYADHHRLPPYLPGGTAISILK